MKELDPVLEARFLKAFEELTLQGFKDMKAEINALNLSLTEMTRRSSWHMHQVGVRDATISELHLKLAMATKKPSYHQNFIDISSSSIVG